MQPGNQSDWSDMPQPLSRAVPSTMGLSLQAADVMQVVVVTAQHCNLTLNSNIGIMTTGFQQKECLGFRHTESVSVAAAAKWGH